MSLGKIHYSEEALKSIIKTEVMKNHPVSSLHISKMNSESETWTFQLEVFLSSFENVLENTKKMQKDVVESLTTMTELTNLKVHVSVKGIKIEK